MMGGRGRGALGEGVVGSRSRPVSRNACKKPNINERQTLLILKQGKCCEMGKWGCFLSCRNAWAQGQEIAQDRW